MTFFNKILIELSALSYQQAAFGTYFGSEFIWKILQLTGYQLFTNNNK
jgi:hypothetical protein